LFNEIYISRSDAVDPDAQNFQVPISYGPREKFLAMTQQKPEGKVRQIQTPRMSFEITGLEYDPDRKLPRSVRYRVGENNFFEPAPYNINFQLNIITKNTLDALKIIEQIFPYFNPDWTVNAQLLPGVDRIWDLPIIRTGQSHTDAYEGDFETKRAVIWTIDFVLKGWLHGPIQQKKVIKFITLNTHGSLDVNSNPLEVTTIQPGLTANGQPTSNVEESINYLLINESDDWGLIIESKDYVPDDD
jgi:hypothetical protein